MRIAAEILAQYTDLPDDPRALRPLLDDLGLEVKRVEQTGLGPVYTLELLANRGDHHCYAGVAREITGRTGGPLRLPEVAPLLVGDGPVGIQIQTPLCLRYSATLLARTGEPRPLSDEALRTLTAAGIHSLTAPVDATNLSNLELGQPTHAFDADKVRGAITIRLSLPGERAWLLFQAAPVTLPVGTLVIADEEKILAIAGVIGCEDSKTTIESARILLESATFDPVAVRKARRALNIHTDASARFERGADPEMPLVGAGRVVHLLEQTGVWRRVGLSGLAGDWQAPQRGLALTPETVRQALGVTLGADEAADRLRRYGFEVERRPTAGGDTELLVRVPTWRVWDVEFVADILEELAKSLGYNATPSALPPVEIGTLPSESERVQALVSEVLVSAGFYEVITDGFYARSSLERLDLPEGHPLLSHVETTNALDRASGLLKNNALLQAVDAAAANLRRKVEDGRIFEFTRTFHLDAAASNGVTRERRLLWALVWGQDRPRGWDSRPRPADVWTLKGLVEEIGLALGLSLTVGPADPSAPLSSLLHPGRQGAVLLDGAPVGLLGELHPSVLRSFGVKRERPCYLEIDEDSLLAAGRRGVFVEPSPLQPIDRSLAFTLPHGFSASAVADHLVEAGPDWLERARITDVFHHEVDGRPVRTVTFALRFAGRAPARTTEELNGALSALIEAIHARFAADGVRLRA